jgi:hypothetical protein
MLVHDHGKTLPYLHHISMARLVFKIKEERSTVAFRYFRKSVFSQL